MGSAKRPAAITGIGATLLVLAPGAAGAGTTIASDAPEPLEGAGHCVIDVVGIRDSGEYITTTPACYRTLAEALVRAGLPVESNDDISFGELQRSGVVTNAAGTIGVHWDGANRSGASITISGADCAGGYVNLSSAWTNRLSSTLNQCSSVVFYDGFDKNGSSDNTNLATVNLGALNNRANSISYGS